MIKRIKY